jgi:hypothetical protein
MDATVQLTQQGYRSVSGPLEVKETNEDEKIANMEAVRRWVESRINCPDPGSLFLHIWVEKNVRIIAESSIFNVYSRGLCVTVIFPSKNFFFIFSPSRYIYRTKIIPPALFYLYFPPFCITLYPFYFSFPRYFLFYPLYF